MTAPDAFCNLFPDHSGMNKIFFAVCNGIVYIDNRHKILLPVQNL